jgi:hypothetical protein
LRRSSLSFVTVKLQTLPLRTKEDVHSMKTFRILCLSAFIMLPLLALAKLPVPNEVLGKVEGALDFCAQADPESGSKYQERKKVFVEGASDKEVAEARASKEYKENYKSATDELSQESKDEVKKTCATALAGKS